MAGQVPATPPPGFARQFGNELRTDGAAETGIRTDDLRRRTAMLGNIISNAPNIAAISGSGAVDKLLDMYPGAPDAPVFGNNYGAATDQLRLADMQAGVAAKNRSGRGTKGSAKDPTNSLAVDPNRMGFVIPDGYDGAGQIIHFDNPEDIIQFGTMYGLSGSDLASQLRAPGSAGTHSVGTSGKGSAVEPGVNTVLDGSTTQPPQTVLTQPTPNETGGTGTVDEAETQAIRTQTGNQGITVYREGNDLVARDEGGNELYRDAAGE